MFCGPFFSSGTSSDEVGDMKSAHVAVRSVRFHFEIRSNSFGRLRKVVHNARGVKLPQVYGTIVTTILLLRETRCHSFGMFGTFAVGADIFIPPNAAIIKTVPLRFPYEW